MTSATQLPGWTHVYSGKVRDLYTSPEHSGRMLVVASDRVSAFDHVLEPSIPGKGALLTRLSTWWFSRLEGIPNHLVATGTYRGVPEEVAHRAMMVKTLAMFPVECVVRGHLAGSGWVDYQSTGSVCGVSLPTGLRNGDRLPEPIYTPAFKAPMGAHDENISFERTVELVGAPSADALRRLSLDIYRRASEVAESSGLIIADTKFEFGADPDTGEITLGDEVLTSDSSRYWDAAAWAGESGVDADADASGSSSSGSGSSGSSSSGSGSSGSRSSGSSGSSGSSSSVSSAGEGHSGNSGTGRSGPAAPAIGQSSRDASETLQPGGHRLDSFDKQIVRDWLLENWDRTSPDGSQSRPPQLPQEIVTRTAARYGELIERLTGSSA